MSDQGSNSVSLESFIQLIVYFALLDHRTLLSRKY